ncbi:MAG TPA: hypothetical protein VD969_06790 [Symbiobacteriaceae bacterium]|nr:hypothetical protein [Symbiobacteriaceae bacterium]
MHFFTVAGHQLMAWSVGIALTVVLLDLGPGLTRDHPPSERRVAGALIGPLAGLSLCALSVDYHFGVTGLIAAPFTVMAILYSWAWIRLAPATRRRTLGWQTGVIGGVSLLVLMLTAGPKDWHAGMVMAAYAASAGLLGGLTCLMVKAVRGVSSTDVEASTSPFGIPARAASIGLGISALAALDGLWWAFGGHSDWLPVMGLWLTLSLVVPGVLMALGHKFYPKLQRVVWSAALLSAIGGQAAIHALTLTNPGLIPPAMI